MESLLGGGATGAAPGLMVGLMASLSMMISSWEKSDRAKDDYKDKNQNYGDTFDFIIVGGGTAGSLLASRLSKVYRVLLLEAGGEPHPFHSIPLLSNFLAGNPTGDWGHVTIPQKAALFASPQNRGLLSGGKGLGGTSILDYMIHLRGHPKDYEEWVKVSGDPGWSYASLIPFFTRHENYEGFWKGKQKGMHGSEGEMHLTQASVQVPGLGKRFILAGNEMGLPHADLNSVYDQAFDATTSPKMRGHRQSSYDAFLRRGQGHRWNLQIHKYATAARVLIRGKEEVEAYGVEYEVGGMLRTAFAKKEVILSAGGIGTPKLLLLSGIGPSEDLQKVGIPARVHLPGVGENLSDQLGLNLGPFYINRPESILMERDVGAGAWLSLSRGQGPLTSSGYEATAMLTSDSARTRSGGDPHWPDVQLTLKSLEVTADGAVATHRLRRKLMEDYYGAGVKRDSFSIVVSGNRPLSRGWVRLANSSPWSPVGVNPAYLERVEDVGVLVDGIKKAMRLVEGSLAFREIGAEFTNRTVGGCAHFRPRSDEYWSCFVRVMALPRGHVVGTAALGRVVDNELRVRGVKRLRVVDASVIPSPISGGTSAATLAIAERGAAMILGYWGPPDKASALLKEASSVGSILRDSAGKLRALDTGALFYEAMKTSPSFKDMAAAALGPIRNPFHLMRPLFQASLMSVGGEGAPIIRTTPTPEDQGSYSIPEWVTQTPATTPRTAPTSSKRPPIPIATLFDTSFTSEAHPPAAPVQTEEETAPPPPVPYLLLPSTTPQPLPHNLGSLIDSYLYAHNPAPHHTTPIPFSRQLGALAFSKDPPLTPPTTPTPPPILSLLRPSSPSQSNVSAIYFLLPSSITTESTPTTVFNLRPARGGLSSTQKEEVAPGGVSSFTQNLLQSPRGQNELRIEPESHNNDLAANVRELLDHTHSTRGEYLAVSHNPREGGEVTTPSSFSQVLYRVMETRMRGGRDKLRYLHVPDISEGTPPRILGPVVTPKEGLSFRVKILNQGAALQDSALIGG